MNHHPAILLLLAAATLLFSPSCSKIEPLQLVEIDRADLEYKEAKYWKDDILFTGRMIKKHTDGAIKSKTDLLDGAPHGLVVEFSENGTQITEVHFEKGTRHGKNTYWHDDGSLMKEQWYNHGKEVEGKTVEYKRGEKPAPSTSG